MARELHLNLFIHGRGHHEAAWRHTDSARRAPTDLAHYRNLALAAEAAKLDSVFFADHVALGADIEHAVRGELEPLTLLGALAALTQRIGLIATASTTYSEPYNLARQFASLDHLSGGRIGWNIVTSWAPAAAANFGQEQQAGIDQRYERAHEFVEVVSKLWDSWAKDAIRDDREAGVYARTDRIQRAEHRGKNFSVAGALNVPRSPQGRPVFVQAGASTDGRAFAARYAEAIFTAHLQKESALAFYSDIKTQARALGRRPDQIVILPGISAAIGSTEAEAQRVWEELNELAHPSVGLSRLSNRFGGHDFSHLKLDQVLSADDFPDPSQVEASRSRAQLITAYVARERPTLRRLLHSLAGARGHFTATGTPEQIADIIEDWFVSGAADGFNVMPPILPTQFAVFTEQVVPLLRKRGLFRSEYRDGTLRDRLGLDPVPSRFDSPKQQQRSA
ncbi:LLM class flavin-dependent oxidoreductase [Bradyrhizobium sp. 61]|uniref:LLM class flavin-dependent oxidoreductase n=1 Tax=unclassified Bradyrhizobium TaxID=2631580 RepID=UPI001FF71062|nr:MULTISPECIES: LLM class flavin-dependent oxidoreductase [unclassified Bradyrhizobium]MCK1274655.1 LLM class flavin-dependent oxidoreductase [Bradyrhizobium sp. 61]MCK1441649.1 LLM class flavin-dependent oxidoreductase [Bradyrhizobium sp. 48]MCK1465191.1 LLM class flavin-dependent oxidoreductase [Bradyrhizobium sp. 2]